jgi:hypothetical protein
MASRQKIILTPYDNVLSGKINLDAGSIYVLLDSTLVFSVQLPDASSNLLTEVTFKNIGALNVTINSITGQFIDTGISHVLAGLEWHSLIPDGDKTWWIVN